MAALKKSGVALELHVTQTCIRNLGKLSMEARRRVAETLNAFVLEAEAEPVAESAPEAF